MDNKIKVLIYCKVSCDIFPDHPEYMTGKEIFDFLMDNLGATFEDDNCEKLIPGDLRLWYLGCNEKSGVLQVENQTWEWSIGDSSFDRVQQFIDVINVRGIFTKEHYNILNEKIEEGRKINWMYDIGDYLQCKAQGKVWENKSKKGREESKRFFGNVFDHFKSKGFKVKPVVETQYTVEMNAEIKKER